MKFTDAVTVSVEVAVDPATAFSIFTEEIGRWWRPGPINWNDSERAVGIRIEPGVGGRWLEVYDQVTGEGFECGRITVWEPGARLVFKYQDAGHDIDGTEVEVSFAAVEGGTRVTLQHRGWDHVSDDIVIHKREIKRWGWASILDWFKDWAFWGSPRRVKDRPQPQTSVQGYVLGQGEGVVEGDASLKASKASTGGSLTLIESHTNGGAPMHVHSREDECFYVVDGEITVQCGSEHFIAGPRSFVFLPRGIPHAWDVDGRGGKTATVLIITVPGGFETFMHDYHAAGGSQSTQKDEIAARHGIQWVEG